MDGDAKSLSVAAASVLAKVHRDRIMRNFDRIYPGLRIFAAQGIWHGKTRRGAGKTRDMPDTQEKLQTRKKIFEGVKESLSMENLNKRELGALIEEKIAALLKKEGYIIKERNFRRKFGEIDIVAFDPAEEHACICRGKGEGSSLREYTRSRPWMKKNSAGS